MPPRASAAARRLRPTQAGREILVQGRHPSSLCLTTRIDGWGEAGVLLADIVKRSEELPVQPPLFGVPEA